MTALKEKEMIRFVRIGNLQNAEKMAKKIGRNLSQEEIINIFSVCMKKGWPDYAMEAIKKVEEEKVRNSLLSQVIESYIETDFISEAREAIQMLPEDKRSDWGDWNNL
jgi:hypothetical protein